MDMNHDGLIDQNEFITAAANHKKVLTKENIKKAFDLFDRNKDG